MSLKKRDLADGLREELGLTMREAREFLDAFFFTLQDALKNGEAVKLAGFGSFKPRQKSSRNYRNPKTGHEIHVARRMIVTFQASGTLRQIAGHRLFGIGS